MFLDFFKSLFGSSECEPENDLPCDIRRVSETVAPLARSEDEAQAYKTWCNTQAYKNWKTFLKKEQIAFTKTCKMAQSISPVRFEQMKCCQNFKLVFDNKIHNANDFRFLLDAFRDALLQNGYQLHTSDVRTYHCSETKKETIERHYLKPIPILIPNQKIDQKYGNITLTLHCKNGVPDNLYCRSAHYRDYNLYKPVHSLAEMMDCLTVSAS
jgi:hypothetical protein